MLRYSRRQLILAALAGATGVSTSGCGILLYPERRGQPKGQLDWGVVALDGLGLLLFVVPGIIAFAVDFGTGAIYLPPESYDGYSDAGGRSPDDFEIVQLTRDELTDERIAAVVTSHAGQRVSLAPADCRREPLRSLDHFWGTRDRVIAELGPRATANESVMRAQSR